MSSVVFLGIGSNVDRHRNISMGLDQLLDHYGGLRVSSVYESDAVGFAGAPFLNLVVAIETSDSVAEIMEVLRDIEAQSGRRRDVPRFSDRTLDIDLLLHGDQVGEVDGVELPRPDITEYAFVLWPLAEIAAERQHPVQNTRFSALWDGFAESEKKLKPVAFEWRGRDLSEGSEALEFGNTLTY